MTPLLVATPSSPPTYNVGMAETHSWIPVDGAGRTLFAQAVYVVNPSGGGGGGGGTTVNLANIEAKLDTIIVKTTQQLGQSGFDVIEAGAVRTGNWTTLTVVSSAAKFKTLLATNSTVGNLTAYEIPITFTMSGPFTSFELAYGAVIAYK